MIIDGITMSLEEVVRTCVDAHEGQTDRNGRPYFEHCFRVAYFQKTDLRKVLGYLHDVLEDCDACWEHQIRSQYGDSIADKLVLLSRPPKTSLNDMSYMDYIKQVCTDRDCMFVKLADIRDNMDITRSDEKARSHAAMYGKGYDYIISQIRHG